MPTTRERLLEAAAELFAERGYGGASMTDIAKRVGVRKPSLYNHCSSKEELFMELLAASLAEWRAASSPALEGPGSCYERLRLHLQETVEFAVKSPHTVALCRLAVSQLTGPLAERAGTLLLEQRREYQRRLEMFFAEALTGGEVRLLAPEVMTVSWLTFLDGILFHQVFSIGARGAYYLQHLDSLWEIFWQGLARSDSTGDGTVDGQAGTAGV